MLKNVKNTATSGKFWANVGWTAAGVVGGELASGLLRKTNVGNTISEVGGAVATAVTGIALNKPEVAVGTVAAKGVKLVGGAI